MASLPVAAGLSITVSPNGRYFTDAQGAPWFMQGDTQWELFRKFTVQDAKSLLDKRVSLGFNAFLVMLNGVPDGNGGVNGARPWLNNNPAAPNEIYFKHVDSVMAVCSTYQAMFIIGVYHKAEASFFTPQTARSYAKFAATRYRNVPNIVWCMYPEGSQQFTETIRAVAAGLEEGDGGTHLISVHPDPAASGSIWQSESWLDFPILQTFSNDFTNYTAVAADYARTPVKPAVNGESFYENFSGTTPLDIRHDACWSWLAGGSYCYGHTENWQNPTNWRNWYESPGAQCMKVLGDFMRSLTWWKMIPDQTIISGTAGLNVAARSSDGDWTLAYLPSAGSIVIAMSKTAASGQVTAVWVSPLDGKETPIGTYAATGTRTFTKPSGWTDALLLIRGSATQTSRPAAPAVNLRATAASVRVSEVPGRIRDRSSTRKPGAGIRIRAARLTEDCAGRVHEVGSPGNE